MKRRSFLAALSAFVAAPVVAQRIIPTPTPRPVELTLGPPEDVYRYKITYVTADGRELTPPLEQLSFGNRVLHTGVYHPQAKS